MNHVVSPDKAKIAILVSLDKGKPKKNDILNYTPVSILNTFSKLYEVFEEQLLSYMEKYFFAYISGYIKGYSSH